MGVGPKQTDPHFPTAYGAAVKYLRERAGLSQEKLAAAMKHGKSMVPLIETDRREGDPATTEALIEALALSDSEAQLLRSLHAAAVTRPVRRQSGEVAELRQRVDRLVDEMLRLTERVGEQGAAIENLRRRAGRSAQ